MKKLLTISLIISLVIIGLGSCSKYEDGPSLSLRSKKARAEGVWTLKSATNNGADVTSNYGTGFKLTLNEDLTAIVEYNGFSIEGKWDLSEDKLQLIITDNATQTPKAYDILRLTNDEFWMNDVDGSNTTKLVFEQ